MRLVPGPVGRLSFTEILDTSLKVSWEEPVDKNGIITGEDFVFSALFTHYSTDFFTFHIFYVVLFFVFYIDLKHETLRSQNNQTH